MPVVTYKCDVCDREREIPQNAKGLEVISRCTITQGCRGKLYQVDFNAQQISGRFPTDVVGLDNYSQRRVLYTHDQSFKTNIWNVNHNLGVSPYIQIYAYVAQDDNTESLIEVEPISIEIVDNDNALITFEYAQKGIAQCIARSANTSTVVLETPDRVNVTITPESELTIATLRHDVDFILEGVFSIPDSARSETLQFAFTDVTTFKSSWKEAKKVLIGGKIYSARSVNIGNTLANAEIIDGSTFYFTRQYISSVGWLPINKDDVIMLLTDSPYASVDININQYLDVADFSSASIGITSNFVDELSLQTYEDVLRTTFPQIRLALRK